MGPGRRGAGGPMPGLVTRATVATVRPSRSSETLLRSKVKVDGTAARAVGRARRAFLAGLAGPARGQVPL